MKKFISFLLCIIVFAAALCACGGSGKDPKITTQPENTQPKQTLPEKTTPLATTQPNSEKTKLFTYEEISFTVPSKFEDITQELGGGVYHFVVGDKLMGVFGYRRDNLGSSYMQYAAMVAQELGISADEITDCGGYARLSRHVTEIETSEEFGIFPVGHYVWVITIKCIPELGSGMRKQGPFSAKIFVSAFLRLSGTIPSKLPGICILFWEIRILIFTAKRKMALRHRMFLIPLPQIPRFQSLWKNGIHTTISSIKTEHSFLMSTYLLTMTGYGS